MNIYVRNLNYNLREEELSQLFGAFGEVSSVKIIKDKVTGRAKGFGFVEMPDDDAASEAISKINGSDVKGRAIQVEKALPPKSRD
ncbi:MAG: RNA-binding protein [Bacteroidetes bacterium]|nr:RNA-binding protein [Bacteroidota bacterium]